MRRSADAQAGTRRVGSRRLPDLRLVRILLVDDDPQAGALIEMALADAPFESRIEVARTAVEGARRIAADAHDIYLIDQLLPDGTGVELIHDAKAHGTLKPFILLTGYGSGALDEAAFREGAADYVEKHLVGTHLERSIRYALRNWQASRTLHERDEQLRQAQKMEAIGRVAGGVAHDFNNLLTTIIGYADLLAERFEGDDHVSRDVAEIRAAAERGAALTRQLLAFSRKQFLEPTILSLNETAGGLLHILPRVIGEHIQITTQLAGDLSRVKADASQMEQVLANLVLNARDAMPEGGRLTIETANVVLDEDRLAAENLTLEPGRYVMLAVTDTGIGMDASVKARAFEPFFTTKPKGKGTGLGLATIYGIVDQSDGGITIDSAPARGTSVRIYLPASNAPETAPKPAFQVVRQDGGTETLLLVEDDDALRELAAKALRSRGYTVHDARSPEEAIAWVTRRDMAVDLLVTDVVMPGLTGPQLAARLLQHHRNLRVLYMSGYTDEARPNDAIFNGGARLLQKPFTPAALAEHVRLALDATAGGA